MTKWRVCQDGEIELEVVMPGKDAINRVEHIYLKREDLENMLDKLSERGAGNETDV